MFFGINLVFGLSQRSIDLAAHVGGLAAGFAGGFVLNLGELAYRKEPKIAVMPLSALWSLPGRRFHNSNSWKASQLW